MNKKLIALAIAGASIAPAAMAQTANPVTLYGRVYVMFESVEATGGASPVVRRNRITDQSSLLGVRGTEDIGGGLKVFFQLETAFAPDQRFSAGASVCTPTGTVAGTTFTGTACNTGSGGTAGLGLFNRNSGVGLQGGWGSFLMGRWDTPFKVATTNIDPFGDLTIGGITSAMNDRTGFDRREQNVLQYWSPDWAGFTVRLHYSVNEFRTATTSPQSESAAVMYAGGPAYAFLTWEKHEDQTGINNNFGTPTSGADDEGWSAGGTWAFGPLKLGGLYQEIKKTNTVKQKAYMANAVWTIGKHQLIYQYQNSKDGGATTAALQPECDVNTVGYQYNFSRRTFFLAQYTKSDNNAAGLCNFGANTLTISAGQDPQGVAVGLRHIF